MINPLGKREGELQMVTTGLNRRRMFATFAATSATLLGFGLSASAQSVADKKAVAVPGKAKTHRLAIHVDENDPAKMILALNNAANVTQFYSGIGEQVEIEIVAYGPGLHMLRADTSPEPVKARMKSFLQSMPNVTFTACENTRENMARAEGKKPADIPLLEFAKSVPSGVVRLIELQEQGWSYVKP